ncbi:hypothetical protein BH20ACI2_BH20ACI2_02740 [soil metagenome]
MGEIKVFVYERHRKRVEAKTPRRMKKTSGSGPLYYDSRFISAYAQTKLVVFVIEQGR